MLVAVVAGCGPMREGSIPPAAAPVDRARVAATPTAPAPAALSHPRILAWLRRLCSGSAEGSVVALAMPKNREQLPRLQAILAEQGVPGELVAVPAVESRFRADVVGTHGERGIWQLRPDTARRLGLQVTEARDDRVHLERSTWAAARYLATLHAHFQDWPLALAAYNAGEARVDRALARRPEATFWELADRGDLPRRSRDYVPKVLAVMRFVSAPGGCL